MRRPITLITMLILAAICLHINCSAPSQSDGDESSEDESASCRAGCVMHNQCLDPDHWVFINQAECNTSCENDAGILGACVASCSYEEDCLSWKQCWAQCLQQDQSYMGNCETDYIYNAIAWMFEDCYIFQNDEGIIDANDICTFLPPELIDCFLDCYDAADECGGDPDPLFNCLLYCLGNYPDDDSDDDITDDDSDGSCNDIVNEVFFECQITLSDLQGNQVDDLGLLEWCELSREYVSAAEGGASPFWKCLGLCVQFSCNLNCVNLCSGSLGISDCGQDVAKVYDCGVVLAFGETNYGIPEMDAAAVCEESEALWDCYGLCAGSFCPDNVSDAISCMAQCDNLD